MLFRCVGYAREVRIMLPPVLPRPHLSSTRLRQAGSARNEIATYPLATGNAADAAFVLYFEDSHGHA